MIHKGAFQSREGLVGKAIYFIVFVTVVAGLWPHLNRSAFYDEAWVLEAAIEPEVTQGWAILLHNSSPAPAGYVTFMHYFSTLVPLEVTAFRVASAMAGGCVVLLALRLASGWTRHLVPTLAVVAVLLLMPMFQRYATEVKQYVFEAAITLGLLLTMRDWVAGPPASRIRAGWIWFLLALLAILCTFAAWFSVAGTGLVAGLVLIKNREYLQLRRAFTFAFALALIAVVIHTQFNRHIAGSATIEGFWHQYYLPLDLNWPSHAFRSLAGLIENCWFRYERVSGSIVLLLAIVGLITWIRHDPVTGFGVLGVLIIPLAAATFKLWPLNLRVNLHMLVLLHLAAVFAPIQFIGWLMCRYGTRNRRENSRLILRWLGLVPALLLLGVVWRESGSADYEIASVDKLLDRTAALATDDDVVVLMPAARVNQSMVPRSIAGLIRESGWVTVGTSRKELIPLMGLSTRRSVLLAVSHHHGAVIEGFAELAESLSSRGRLTIIWQDRFVALYRFTHHPSDSTSSWDTLENGVPYHPAVGSPSRNTTPFFGQISDNVHRSQAGLRAPHTCRP